MRLAPFLNNIYDDEDLTSKEIDQVVEIFTDAAERFLPHVQPT